MKRQRSDESEVLIDTHAHLDLYDPKDLDGIHQRAEENGVERIITIGTDLPSCLTTLELIGRYPPVFGAVGFHPHEAKTIETDGLSQLKEWAKHPKVKAIGEIGLDYYRDYSPRKRQQEAFKAQIEIASELGLPVIIHNRDADQDTLKLLKKSGLPGERVLFHCFSGDVQMAKELAKIGCYLSIAGPVTFKNAKKTVEVVKAASLKKLMLETDCPYLAPQPYRGRPNEPGYLPLIAEKVAEIKGISVEDVASVTTSNAEVFFALSSEYG